MADIVEKLLAAAGTESQSQGALLKEAADEIGRLRGEYSRLMSELDKYQRLAEPEF